LNIGFAGITDFLFGHGLIRGVVLKIGSERVVLVVKRGGGLRFSK
jgi:hypothetical protein